MGQMVTQEGGLTDKRNVDGWLGPIINQLVRERSIFPNSLVDLVFIPDDNVYFIITLSHSPLFNMYMKSSG